MCLILLEVLVACTLLEPGIVMETHENHLQMKDVHGYFIATVDYQRVKPCSLAQPQFSMVKPPFSSIFACSLPFFWLVKPSFHLQISSCASILTQASRREGGFSNAIVPVLKRLGDWYTSGRYVV